MGGSVDVAELDEPGAVALDAEPTRPVAVDTGFGGRDEDRLPPVPSQLVARGEHLFDAASGSCPRRLGAPTQYLGYRFSGGLLMTMLKLVDQELETTRKTYIFFAPLIRASM